MTFQSCPEALQETEIKGSEQTAPAEKTARQHNTQGVAWISLLARFILRNRSKKPILKVFSFELVGVAHA